MHIAISKAQINSNANPGHSKPIKNTFIYTTTSHTRLKQQRLSKNTSIFHHHQLNAHITALISRQIKTCHTNSTLVLSLDTLKKQLIKRRTFNTLFSVKKAKILTHNFHDPPIFNHLNKLTWSVHRIPTPLEMPFICTVCG